MLYKKRYLNQFDCINQGTKIHINGDNTMADVVG